MEIILAAEVEESASSESLDRSEAAAESGASNGLPRHPSGAIRLRRKAEQDA
jgi:hypothetical protein